MVTYNMDNNSQRMSRPRRGSSVSSGFRLLDADQLDTLSSVSRNSIYKLKIDAMFDDTRSIISQRIDDRSSVNLVPGAGGRRRSSSVHGGGSIIGNGRTVGTNGTGSDRDLLNNLNDSRTGSGSSGSGRKESNNCVQAQIERMFNDVAKEQNGDGSTQAAAIGGQNFSVRCLGSLPLKDKVTSLLGLQEPLWQLYLSGAGHGTQNSGTLDISVAGLRVRTTGGREPLLTPFQNIAVWSAVKFVVSVAEGGAAFLPLITDPENIDKRTLFRPLSAADKRRLSSGLHSPLFAVVMRSSAASRQLECHGFVCQTPEDAIVIAATLYQSLMAHMGNGENQRSRRPKNRNGISCMSIASSAATTNLNLPSGSAKASSRRSIASQRSLLPPPPRPPRKSKRTATSSLSGESDTMAGANEETSTEERRKRLPKGKRPPLPANPPRAISNRPALDDIYTDNSQSNEDNPAESKGGDSSYPPAPESCGGDIFTRVAIPRSGSFLNTAGLARYKSRATRRHAGKVGGGGGSPLGFSELFNEFRLQENLHSLDDILNAIINSDGMSFNDLKPIYKEFLLKLAVTLTKDELYQRSKSIMRRQKKKKLKRKNSNAQNQRRKLLIGAKGLKKVFRFGRFRSKKSLERNSDNGGKLNSAFLDEHELVSRPNDGNRKPSDQISIEIKTVDKKDRSRIGTSGSELSEARHEHTHHNRNSSSGYVSCSECSYDSDACTCSSADRCYCSLGGDDINAKLNEASNRNSLPSCKSDDKCYCSMGETQVEDDGSTTWCDTDSCVSNEKCYCPTRPGQIQKCAKKSSPGKKKSGKLGLDYELFTVGGNGRSVNASEALSVKKAVEVAAVFTNVKLSQTTDIKNMKKNQQQLQLQDQQQQQANAKKHPSKNDHHSHNHHHTHNSSINHRRHSESKHEHKSNHKMSNKNAIVEQSTIDEYHYIQSSQSDVATRKQLGDKKSAKQRTTKSESYYQAFAPRLAVGSSLGLEDSLGYLP
ncbi:uncharacterized protein LOC129777071 [Toxorhynchites rutilus septentrionalis]|uniref:uncharacterized protein LOC129777071 n=1 Tax=Toxorhynchites rutilus septentrionalis TaxID=329112 RepID=UPI002479FD4A|nr:uncharacterized protein LOC129777071 [Toxorhynchites rutilus septentrionalis]XP_055639111.1 uncharacterized protein LOC129777071 [Toxorhynchites rutilus septentrionalis]XP_055639112.1 uncharacterized protein LOC129777071 [Toxorhynchites rutilus septentrionalis]